MSVVNRREYLRNPVGRSPVADAIGDVLNAMPIGGTRSGILAAAGAGDAIPDSGLLHDYDPRDLTGAGESNVATITDSKGSSDLTQATASNQATLETNGINGLQSIDFDGSDWYTVDIPDESQPVTIVWVVSPPTDTGDAENVWDGDTREYIMQINYSGVPADQYLAGQNGSSISGGTPSTGAQLLLVRYDGANSVIRKNSSQIASGTLGTQNLIDFQLGSSRSDGGPFNGLVGQGAIYNPNAAGYSRSDVESYFTSVWGPF